MNFYLAPNGEIIEPVADDDGAEIAIEQRFHPDFVATLVPYDPENPPEPEPEPEPEPVAVTQVTKRQAALALYDAGKYDAVMSALKQDPRAMVEWDASAVIDRDSTLVQQLGAGLSLDLEALFKHAATL